MATGFAATFANQILDFLFRAVSFTPPTTYYVKLHTGDPGAAGTANAAGNTTRKAGTFATGASAGNLSNTSIVSWVESEVTASETWTHASLWDAATAGTFKMSGALTSPRTVSSGASASIAVGDIDISLNVAS